MTDSVLDRAFSHRLTWPALPLDAWLETHDTLRMWTQIAGKIRLALTPEMNHWWNVALYVNSRGLTTSPIPYGGGLFEMQFDFVEHYLEIHTSHGDNRAMPLEPMPVAGFYRKLMRALDELGISVSINTKPQELPDPIPFDQDERHASYDREFAHRFWRVLLSTHIVLSEFRARFVGKSSPVHFFWGSFDLACSRFSGRRAEPPRKGVISGPAYSHEVSSAGFWPGAGLGAPAFYAYTVPQPEGLPEARIQPAAASWNKDLGEFIYLYDDFRREDSRWNALMDFLESTYEAGANLANWNRAELERDYPAVRRV
jgi:hypothetical protein